MRLRVLAATAMAVMVTVTVTVTAAALAPVASPQKAGMAELFTAHNRITGRIGNSWWQSAVALSTMETYEQATGTCRDRGKLNTVSWVFVVVEKLSAGWLPGK